MLIGHQCSDSLATAQAICFDGNTNADENNRAMETNDERRRRKLTDLVNEHGIEKVAEAAGLSAQYLDQIIKRRLLPPKRGDGSRSSAQLLRT